MLFGGHLLKGRTCSFTLTKVSLPLTSGSRPPLLIDILRTAEAIGGDSQLIVEIKPGNVAAASALARMFLRHPELMARCAVVMSFDAFAMHSLRRDLRALDEARPEGDPAAGAGGAAGISLPSAMSLGNLGFRVKSAAVLHFRPEGATHAAEEHVHNEVGLAVPAGDGLSHARWTESMDHFGIGQEKTGNFVHDTSPTVTPGSANPSSSLDAHAGRHTGKAASFMPALGSLQSIRKSSLSSLQFSPSTSPQPVSFMTAEGNRHNPPALPKKRGRPRRPQLMLLTVAEEPKIDCELRTSVSNLSECEHWLRSSDGNLDGVYLQFEPEMLTAEGARALRDFAGRGHRIGMWGYSGRDPDTWESFHYLCREGGLSYVNTDLPKNFKRSPSAY